MTHICSSHHNSNPSGVTREAETRKSSLIVEHPRCGWRWERRHGPPLPSGLQHLPPAFDHILTPQLCSCCGRLAPNSALVCPAQQPERPTGTAETHQQDRHSCWLAHPPTLPIEQRTLEQFMRAFLPPATGIFDETYLLAQQIGDQIPGCGRTISSPMPIQTDGCPPRRALPNGRVAGRRCRRPAP
jgi:hypothetical protein